MNSVKMGTDWKNIPTAKNYEGVICQFVVCVVTERQQQQQQQAEARMTTVYRPGAVVCCGDNIRFDGLDTY